MFIHCYSKGFACITSTLNPQTIKASRDEVTSQSHPGGKWQSLEDAKITQTGSSLHDFNHCLSLTYFFSLLYELVFPGLLNTEIVQDSLIGPMVSDLHTLLV